MSHNKSFRDQFPLTGLLHSLEAPQPSASSEVPQGMFANTRLRVSEAAPPLAESGRMGTSKAQLVPGISWEVTERLALVWKQGYVKETVVKAPGMGDGTTFTVNLHPSLYLAIQSCSPCAQEQPTALPSPCRCIIHMGTQRPFVVPEVGEGSPPTPDARDHVAKQNGSPLAQVLWQNRLVYLCSFCLFLIGTSWCQIECSVRASPWLSGTCPSGKDRKVLSSPWPSPRPEQRRTYSMISETG